MTVCCFLFRNFYQMDLPNLKIIGLCLLISGEARCGDKSDQKFCLDSVFTGCFTNTSLGLRIVDCASCFCQLGDLAGQVRLTARNTDLTSLQADQREGLVYTSGPAPDSKISVVARICMERLTKFLRKYNREFDFNFQTM